jgi:hypothetical protein
MHRVFRIARMRHALVGRAPKESNDYDEII